MEKILMKGLNYKHNGDFIRNLYNDKIVEVIEMVRREAKQQGKKWFAIRTTTPEIDTSDPLQAKVNIGFDTKLLESEVVDAMMYDSGWMVFSIDDYITPHN